MESLSNAYSQLRAPVGDRCSMVDARGECVLYQPALVELFTRPEAFHLKRVQVAGFVSLQFERNVLCLSEHGASSECLWLDIEGVEDPGFREGRVLIAGTFDGENRGHFGGYAGALRAITRLQKVR